MNDVPRSGDPRDADPGFGNPRGADRGVGAPGLGAPGAGNPRLGTPGAGGPRPGTPVAEVPAARVPEAETLGSGTPVLQARGLVKRYGHVTALDGADFDLMAGEVLAVIGDNGAGKTSLIKALTGALQPDEGEILLDGKPVRFRGPLDARRHGIETVYQDLAVAASMDIASNMFLGREVRRPGPLGMFFRMLDKKRMREESSRHMADLKIGLRSLTQPVESLSGGQRQGVAVARAVAWARHVVVMDEPTAALGVKESGQVLDMIRRVRDKGLPVILISHNMPHVFEIADRIHVQRLGRRVAQIKPGDFSMAEVVAIMTGAMRLDTERGAVVADQEAAHAIGLS
ncbi:ATP-binding cassette domain-containing protein [Streptosporangium fragile]|uniref:ATP-binding cassette domain-containing protein n=1 Tax=Streptosporangium fragile TaxID=46186 RepID=A0ABN3VUV3_9ACTN